MNKIRFGILGSGYMGRTHAEAVRRSSRATLVAISGGSRALALAADYRVAAEESPEALLRRADVDAVIIATPHHLHVEQALAALAAGKHVLVEKPLATSVRDCDRIIASAREKNLSVGVGYQQRFRANNVRAQRLLGENAIGRIQAVLVSMPMYSGVIKAGGFGGNWDWWNSPASVGHVFNSAPHAVDLLRWFTGSDVVTVSAFSRTLLPDLVVEDTTLALLEFSSGAVCSLFSSRALPAPSFVGEDFRFRITGSSGLIDLDPYGELRLADVNGWRVICQQPAVGHEDKNSAFGDVRMQAYLDQIDSFLDAIEGKPGQAGTAADGRAGVAVCEAMLRSSSQRQWVDL